MTDGILADGASCDRLVYALFMMTNKPWEDRPLWGKTAKKASIIRRILDATGATGALTSVLPGLNLNVYKDQMKQNIWQGKVVDHALYYICLQAWQDARAP